MNAILDHGGRLLLTVPVQQRHEVRCNRSVVHKVHRLGINVSEITLHVVHERPGLLRNFGLSQSHFAD